MKTLTATTGIVSLSIFSPDKSKDATSRRLLRFSVSPQSNNNGNPDSTDSAVAPILRNGTLSKDAEMGLVLSAANVRGWTTGSGLEGQLVPASSGSYSVTEQGFSHQFCRS